MFTFYGRFRRLRAMHIHAYVCAVCWPDLPCVEVRAHIGCLPQTLSTLLFETRSLAELVCSLLFQLDWLASEPPESVHLYLSPHQGCGAWCPSQHFYTGSRDRNSGSHAWVASPFFTKPLPQTLCARKAAQFPLCSHPTQVNGHKTFETVACQQKSICRWLERAMKNASLWAWQGCTDLQSRFSRDWDREAAVRLRVHLESETLSLENQRQRRKKNPKVLLSHLFALEGLESSCAYLSEQHFHVFMH